jgi:hypothetical protein
MRPLVLLSAIGVLILAVIMLLLAVNLLPTSSEAQERGVYAAWVITWMMAWMTILCGFVLAGYLAAVSLRSGRAAVARTR